MFNETHSKERGADAKSEGFLCTICGSCVTVRLVKLFYATTALSFCMVLTWLLECYTSIFVTTMF